MIGWNELEEVLRRVEKPGRYLGGEWNAVKKDPDRVRIKIALAFPDLYEVGMSYLGQKILYGIINSQSDMLAERVFAPWVDFERELKSKKMPLHSLENRIPLDLFDIIGFSLLYELNYSNILTMLELGRIPFYSEERDLGFPLVIAGGPAAFNPEPVADFFDLFVIGDGEDVFLEIVRKYMVLKREVKDKMPVMEELAAIEGVYVPSLYRPFRQKSIPLMAVRATKRAPDRIKKRVLYPFHQAPFSEDIVVPHIQVIFDRVAWEIARGCPQNCRFCQASSIYFPPRIKSPSSVIRGIMNSLKSTGYDGVSLSSLSVSDYPYLEEVIRSLMTRLEKQKVSLSLPSLRPKGLTSEIAENIVKVRKTGFTLVPEAGTERLRSVINKCLSDQEIREAIENAFRMGWKRLKLYFMIGLPTENEEDLSGILSMVGEIIQIGKRILKKPPLINLSVSAFIPKPHTPFQWLPMEPEGGMHNKYRYVLSRLKKYPSVRMKRDLVERSVLEGVFSRGDRRLNAVLRRAWEAGARFDSWNDMFQFPIWEKAFDSENIDFREYLSGLDTESVLPWDHIDTGLKKNLLRKELELALNEKSSPACPEKDCASCQGCNLSKFYQDQSDGAISYPEEEPPYPGVATEDVQRYRATFRKTGRARFLSHMDLNNLIQQGFRRAGIPVRYSQGFHPKMMISYLPALPMGMAGHAEWMEFKSSFIISENEFLARINQFMIDGIEFLELRRLDANEPSMNRRIEAYLYSLDLKDKKVTEAMEKLAISAGRADNFKDAVEKLADDFLKKSKGNSLQRIVLDEKRGKLLLFMKNIPHGGEKPQDIVNVLLGLENPTFFMAREEILLANQAKTPSCD